MTFLQTLESSVNTYRSRLYDNPDAKDERLELGQLQRGARAHGLAALREVWNAQNSIFGRFALAKHALELCYGTTSLSGANDLIAQWFLVCVEAGAYRDCISFSERCITSGDFMASTSDQFSILRSRAKSLRNLGRLSEAQNCYREIIARANQLNDSAEISLGLLLIGKLYGNYWGQLSLFSSFVEEAKARLEHDLKASNLSSSDVARLKRRLAICHDALGQAYRHSEPSKVELHFQEAIKLNNELGRANGLSRTLCHWNYLKFTHSTPAEQPTYLKGFNDGIRILLGEHSDERGLGIRYVQYSSMLLKANKSDLAGQYLTAGKYFASRYSEYKTLTRAALVEASLYKSNEPEQAIRALQQGLSISRRYGLEIQEGELNLTLAEFSNRELTNRIGSTEIEVADLLKRNREIYVRLINEVKGSLAKLNAGELPHEFELLSVSTRATFREKLLLDFDRVVNQLDQNLAALVTALSLNERKRRELVVLEVVNSVARAVLHEYKSVILAESTFTPIQDIATELTKLGAKLETLRTTNGIWYSEVDEIITALEKRTGQLLMLGGKLGELKTLLSERLRRPQDLKDRISLRDVIEKAVQELQQQNALAPAFITFIYANDVKLFFSHDLMVTVIQNLIRNALEELGDEVHPENRILVSLGSQSDGDAIYRNPSIAASLSIVTVVVKPGQSAATARAIREGLEGKPSSKPFGCGVGMDLTRLIFRDLLGAAIDVVEDERSAGIKITFRTDPINAEMVTN